jgi:glucose-1-phosphate cytidylyltransferase
VLGPVDIPVFILCGGRGTRLGEAGASLPKPMLDIGEKPMLAHIMDCYGRAGFRRFVLCAGWRGEAIVRFVRDYLAITSDFTLDTRSGEVSYHQSGRLPDWEITVAHTGFAAMTGARIARAAGRYLGEAEHFAVTYGDGLTDVDLAGELDYHLHHDRLGTVLAVNPPSPFGRFELGAEEPVAFTEKPRLGDTWVNGGYFFFRRGFLDYLSSDDGCILEDAPLRRLVDDRQLALYRHAGFWSCVDTVRDRARLEALWESGAAPWQPPAPP